jgi:hypothetical protein
MMFGYLPLPASWRRCVKRRIHALPASLLYEKKKREIKAKMMRYQCFKTPHMMQIYITKEKKKMCRVGVFLLEPAAFASMR